MFGKTLINCMSLCIVLLKDYFEPFSVFCSAEDQE